MTKKRQWTNADMRALTKGEAHNYINSGKHYYSEKDWYIWFDQQRNDLQQPAISTEPVIDLVLKQLKNFNPIVARMSGSGATCFALFETLEQAKKSAKMISKDFPKWWTTAGSILG